MGPEGVSLRGLTSSGGSKRRAPQGHSLGVSWKAMPSAGTLRPSVARGGPTPDDDAADP